MSAPSTKSTSPRQLAALLAVAVLVAPAAGVAAQDSKPSRDETAAPEETPETATPADKVEHWLAITGGDVHLGTGQVLRRASVLVGDDKIREVGHDLQIPAGAEVIDATGKVVAPGLVAVKAGGMGAPNSLSDGEVKDSLNPFDPSIKMGLAAGVTSFVASFDAGTDRPGGKTAVIKPAAGKLDAMVVAENSVYSMRVPLAPQDWQELRELVEKAKKKLAEEREEREQAAAPEPAADAEGEGDGESEGEGEEKGTGKDDADQKGKKEKPAKGLDEMVKVLRREAVLWVSTQGAFDEPAIRQALKIAELLGVGVVLDNPVTAWAMADEVAATDSMAILDPRLREEPDPAQPDRTGSRITSSGVLSRAGVPLAVRSPGGRFGGPTLGTGGILGQDLHTLHIDAAFAVRGGMDDRKALRTITLDAARIAGVASRVGSIEVGKDADLLILDGDPLHYRTFVETAVVNGKVVYEKDKEPFYSHITR